MPARQDIEYDGSFELGTNFTLRGNSNVFHHLYEYYKLHGRNPEHHVNLSLGRTKPHVMYSRFLETLTEKFEGKNIRVRRIQVTDIYEVVKNPAKHVDNGELLQIEGTTVSIYAFRSGQRNNLFLEMFAGTDEEFDILSELASHVKEGYVKNDEVFKDMFNMISHDGKSLELLEYEVNHEKFGGFDIDLLYNDDFKEVAAHIETTLSKTDGTTGIALLHGVYGSGKTTYLRHLIATIKKRIIYMPPDMAEQLGTPSFINFIRNYPNSILIIEDAEKILRRREDTSQTTAVSNLLNMSDGILGDALNMQIVCTFNCPIEDIDEALTRKGRLIANYFFDFLSEAKTKALVKHVYGENVVPLDEKMSVADIYGMNSATHNEPPKIKRKIGFQPN